MLANERERLERRAEAKAEAVETVATNRAEALARRDALRAEAGYPASVARNVVGEVVGQDDQEETEEVRPYEEWTNEELSNELKARELPHSGNKEELVARLTDSDNADEQDA